ncbi:response regulator [Deltaproteobacteria bacterium TL4]
MTSLIVVDDDSTFLTQIAFYLESMGYDLEYLSESRFLFQMLESMKADLILMDISMPENDGIRLLGQLKAHPAFRTIPVIMMTSGDSDEVLERCLELGAVDFISKPVNEVALKARVRSALKIQSYIDRLKESEANYRMITETATDAIITIDAESTILFANKAVEKIFGYSLPELLGQKITLLMPEEMREAHLNAISRYTETKQKHISWKSTELEGLHKRGHKVPLDISFGEITLGQKTVFTSIIRDITERNQLHAQLRKAERMKSIGVLAGGIAHDFNNILAIIMGYAQLLQPCVKETPVEKDYVNRIIHASNRAKKVVLQLRDLASHQDKQLKPVLLSHVVDQALKMATTVLPENVKVHMELEAAHDIRIRGNESQLYVMIISLCVNAKEAMPTGGMIKVSLNSLTLKGNQTDGTIGLIPGDYLRLTIEDTGHGMDKETLEHVFDPFYTTKGLGGTDLGPSQDGTGLGLYIVYNLVLHHHGKIVAESRPGEGTTFKLYFPVYGEPAVAPQEEKKLEILPKAIPESIKLKILLVEDEAYLARCYSSILELEGYQVTLFNNGKDALINFQNNPDQYDLVLTDQIMSEMLGHQLSEELLKLRSEIPIIIMTGYSEILTKERTAELGIRKLLLKPFSTENLLDVIQEVMFGKVKNFS